MYRRAPITIPWSLQQSIDKYSDFKIWDGERALLHKF